LCIFLYDTTTKKLLSYNNRCRFCFFIVGKSTNLDIVYAIDTSDATNDNILAQMKRYASASLDYYNIADDQSHFGLVSFGSKTKVPLELLSGVSEQVVRYSLENLPRVGGKIDLLGMLNSVETLLFYPQSRDGTKKMLVVFLKSDSPTQFTDDVKNKMVDLKRKGIQPAFVLINDDENDDDEYTASLNPLVGNFLIMLRSPNSLPAVYPDYERFVGNLVGKIGYFCY